MNQPFEFKNPLEGALPPLGEKQGENPFSDGDHVRTDVSDNIYATSSGDVAEHQPEFVTTFSHRGPLLLRLAISNGIICLISCIVLFFWETIFYVVLASGVLAIALAIKSGYDLAAMRSAAMASGGRGMTLAALLLSLAAAITAVAAVCVILWSVFP